MEGSPARHKLRDLALLMEGYDQILAGRYQDGEGELARGHCAPRGRGVFAPVRGVLLWVRFGSAAA